jgi:hypothetical protein
MLAAVAVVVPLTILATRPDAATRTPGPARGPDFSLTDEEAIAEFEDLRSGALAAVRNRDHSLLDEIFTLDGPVRKRAQREIESLAAADVADESVFVSDEITVLRNAPDEIMILEESRLRPCFRNADGEDVSEGPAEVSQTALWTLRLADTRWLLHDAVIRRDRVVEKGPASCE